MQSGHAKSLCGVSCGLMAPNSVRWGRCGPQGAGSQRPGCTGCGLPAGLSHPLRTAPTAVPSTRRAFWTQPACNAGEVRLSNCASPQTGALDPLRPIAKYPISYLYLLCHQQDTTRTFAASNTARRLRSHPKPAATNQTSESKAGTFCTDSTLPKSNLLRGGHSGTVIAPRNENS